jgi:hypothetical protein
MVSHIKDYGVTGWRQHFFRMAGLQGVEVVNVLLRCEEGRGVCVCVFFLCVCVYVCMASIKAKVVRAA